MDKNNDLILMANAIIGSRFKLGVNEIKILLHFINYIDEENSDFWTYTIPAKNFNIDYKKLKASAKALMSKPALEIPREYNPNLPPNEQEWLFVHWFADIEYKRGYIEASFSPKLKPYLLALKECYTGFNLRYILPLQGQYSIRLYQLLKAEEFKNRKVTFKLDYLYNIFQVPKSYKDYRAFNNKILKLAYTELREHTDVYFEYETIKDGKKVVEVTFTIFTNNKNQTFVLNKEIVQFKKMIAPQYVNQEIIEYKGVKYKINEKFNIDGVDKNKAIEIWQYIYKNKDKLLDIKLPLDYKYIQPQWHLTKDFITELGIEFGIAQIGDKFLLMEFEHYLEEQEKIFLKFCKDNNKQYSDMNLSFKRHIDGACQARIDFFVKFR